MTEIQRDLVLHLLRQGDWREAVDAYAEEAGVTRREAEDGVAQLAETHGVRRRSYGWLTLAAVASAASLALLWLINGPF